MDDNQNERELFTLTDEDGKEFEFEKIGETERDGVTYFAMIPTNPEEAEADEDGFCEYVILRLEENEDGAYDLVSVEDDEEFDDVADLFDDMFSEEIDYDGDKDKK